MEAPISGEGQRYNQEQRQAQLRDTRAYVSLEAIRYNTGLFRRQLNPRTSLMAVVKANGYGHGAVEAAQAALEAGADRLGVAVVDEALQLRAAGIDRPILVLGYTSPSAVRPAVEHDVAVTVYSGEVLEALVAAAQSLGKIARMHLKLDTGMNRIGLSDPQEILALA
ncbi:MAG: alanine racemase, partial [Paenibacillus sp.]|nr:alanine racemase [Paenibacillus sp.]